MDISVIIPSRGRTRGLAATLYGMQFLESGKHRVHYGVACDDDDPATITFCAEIQKHMNLSYRAVPRHPTLGEAINKLADLMPAQVYVLINDDVLVLTDKWDDVIAKAVEETPHGVFWWTSKGDANVLFPIITDKWKAACGSLLTSFFPFWYDDLCLCELWVMTTDKDNIFLPIDIIDKPKTVTHRMRELTFWQKVYTASRALRITQAREIAEKLGLPPPQSTEYIAKLMNAHLKTVSDAWIQQIEDNQGDKAEPDEAYKIAKARALALFPNVHELKLPKAA